MPSNKQLVKGDWRDFRPAIWIAMIGVAVMLLVHPWYAGALLVGWGIGVAARVIQRRRQLASAARARGPRRRGGR